MSDDWENEDFVPNFDNKGTTDQWAGEDEDDAVKDNWEDEDEPKKEPETVSTEAAQPTVKRNTKKQLAKKIAEKEAEKNGTIDKDIVPLTPEEQSKEKARVRKAQESADLNIAKDLLGVSHSIDSIDPSTPAEFNTLKDALIDKITLSQKSEHFAPFLENFLTDLATLSETEELKKLGLIFTNMYHERNRQVKEDKKKTKNKKKALNMGGRNDISDLVDLGSQGQYDDYSEDFM